LRIFLIIRAVGPIAFLLLLSGGCNQDTTQSKPPVAVVKKIPGEGAPSEPKKAEGKAEVKPEKKAAGKIDEQANVPDSGAPKEDQGLAPRADYAYDPRNRPDPFVPFFKPDKEKEGAWECEGIPRGPLTDKEVAQFTLVAVVNRSGESVAMVQDPEWKGHLDRP
jgi:hypothetical protein